VTNKRYGYIRPYSNERIKFRMLFTTFKNLKTTKLKLHDCQKEIKEREYLLGTELQHISGTHKILIDLLEPKEVMVTGLYYIQCHYKKQNEAGVYRDVLLANKLGDILTQYIAY